MIPKECKRLAEVDFPIAVVSRHAAREKYIRDGNPSTLHLWWARRPLASTRAVLLSLLLPDPCDPHCPSEFKNVAPQILSEVRQTKKTDEDLQKALLWFVGTFSNWDLATNRTYLRVAQALVKASYQEAPLVVDPFAGGGSIPVEALRLGCETFASDLNPVACLILKVMLEDIPRSGQKLADELRRVGAEIRRDAQKELGELYPNDPDRASPIAYLWARTIRCEAPNCGAEIPLVRSFWLAKKASRRRALRPFVERPKGELPRVQFEVYEPKNERDIAAGSITRAKATCFACGTVLSPTRVRAQLSVQRGGADVIFDSKSRRTGGARMLAVVTLRSGDPGRHYRLPEQRDYEAVRKAQLRIADILNDWEHAGKQGLCPVPDEPLPPIGTLGFRVQRYGMLQWGDIFTARQKVTLLALTKLVREVTVNENGLAREPLALIVDKIADKGSSGCRWKASAEYMAGNTFSRQALPIVWDFCEVNALGAESGSVSQELDWVTKVIEFAACSVAGQVQVADATEHPLPDQTAAIWFTDPPYYDAVPYADLSDFFFVWLKRILPNHRLIRDPFDPLNALSPKRQEAVQDETKRDNGRQKNRAWFEETMARAFAEGRRVLREDGVGSVVFAHKTTEGWEALLSGLIRGGWTISGSWPIATEMGARLRARESAALATSVHLICRPRPDNAPVGDWGDILRELPKRVGDWMERLESESVRGADLVFACIGPALEIFSRYGKVETAGDTEVPLSDYLEKVWEIVGRTALENILGTAEARARNGVAGALEEDSRLTALFLWTLETTAREMANGEDEEELDEEDEDNEGSSSGGKPKGLTLVFDVVRRFAQPLGIALPKWDGRVIEIKKGVVRLLPISERAKQLFGEDGAQTVAARLEQEAKLGNNPLQGMLFPDLKPGTASPIRGRRRRGSMSGGDLSDDRLSRAPEATTLDRVHAAMLLQAAGRTNALRALLKAEQERGPDFLRLANALSALYPKASEEKRLLDAMLLGVPR